MKQLKFEDKNTRKEGAVQSREFQKSIYESFDYLAELKAA